MHLKFTESVLAYPGILVKRGGIDSLTGEKMMPLYEYKCEACQHVFEELIRRAEEEEQLACPKCGDKRVMRLMSAFATGGGAGSAGNLSSHSCNPGG